MDRHLVLKQDVDALSWEEFQRLVHELVKKERPSAIPLDGPDGGADTVIPADDTEPKEVVQAKHYRRDGIKWAVCQS